MNLRALIGLAMVMCAGSLLAAQKPAPLSARPQDSASSVPRGLAEAYYTDAQAARGATAYKQHCEKCHADGYKNHARMKFQGKPAYPSVYYLYTRLKDQPPQTTSIT